MPSSLSYQLIPGERPAFTFCEPEWASGHGLWCIRATTEVGPKHGGGVDTASLCGRVPVHRGWDLEARITEHHLKHSTCHKCCAAFRGLMPGAYYELAYAILLGAGAPPSFRDEFVRYFAEQPTGDCLEWRFQGKLGYGGKFWKSAGRHYVDCYPEDQSPERAKLIEGVNERIAAIPGPGA